MARNKKFEGRLARLCGGTLNQAAASRKLGVARATVNEWVSGKRTPSSEAYFKMAMAADDPADKVWFLNRAGLTSGHMREVLELLESEQEPSVLVPPLDGGAHEIRVSASLVPRQGKLGYAILPEQQTAPFRGADIVIVDASEKDGQRLLPFWDDLILVDFRTLDFPPEERLLGPEVAGYRIGELELVQTRPSAEERDVLEYVPELRDVGPHRYGPGLRLGPPWRKPYARGIPPDASPRETKRAAFNLEAHKSIVICGSVVTWFRLSKNPSDLRPASGPAE